MINLFDEGEGEAIDLTGSSGRHFGSSSSFELHGSSRCNNLLGQLIGDSHAIVANASNLLTGHIASAPPRFQRKAANQLLAEFSSLSRTKVLSVVQEYCREEQDQRSIPLIIAACRPLLQRICNSTIQHEVIIIDDCVDGEEPAIKRRRLSPVQDVLQVFPDAKLSYVKQLLSQQQSNVDAVVRTMLEYGYEKIENVVPHRSDEVAIDFSSSTSFTPTATYQEEALLELQRNYPFLQVKSLRSLLSSHQFHFYPTVREIMTMTGEKPLFTLHTDKENAADVSKWLEPSRLRIRYNRSKLADLGSRIAAANRIGSSPTTVSLKRCFTRDLLCNPLSISDRLLMEEIRWMQRKENEEIAQKDAEIAEKLNQEIAAEEGALIECGCCFTEFAFDSLVQCSEGHLFCKHCLQAYAEQQVFGNGRSALRCMDSSSASSSSSAELGCCGFFPESILRRALPDKVFEKYSEAVTRDALKAANIDNLTQCFKCSLQVEIDSNGGIIMKCPDCGAETCTLCGEESHVPLKCNEVEKKAETSSRVTVEEAMTQARLRQCNKCKTRFYKTEGCNKMTCSCGTRICYVCRKDITKEGYQHFCQTPHCDHKKCGKCKLYTNSVEDDIQAMREAGVKALTESVSIGTMPDAATNNIPSGNDAATRIDINRLLETTPSNSSAAPVEQEGDRILREYARLVEMQRAGNRRPRPRGGGRFMRPIRRIHN